MKKLEIKVFIDADKEAEKSIHHLNLSTNVGYYFKYEIIPNDAYSYEEDSLSFSVNKLLKKLIINDNSASPIIIITNRYTDFTTQLLNDKNIFLISTYSLKYDHKSIATLIFSATLELLDQSKYRGLVSKFLISFNEGISNLGSDIKKVFIAIFYNEESDFHVLITHGIRTHCHWAEASQKELKSSFGISSTIIRYGFVNLLQFLAFESVQKKIAFDLLVTLIDLKQQNNSVKLGIITHSYSSLLIGKAIELADQLKIDIEIESIIMNGSILPQSFNWSHFLNKEKKTGVRAKRILNICGDKDIWPIFANRFAPSAGKSGTFFFSENSERVLNLRIKNCGHSDMLTSEIARDYWGKFIIDDNYSPPYNEDSYPTRSVTCLDYILSNYLPLTFAVVVLWIFIVFIRCTFL